MPESSAPATLRDRHSRGHSVRQPRATVARLRPALDAQSPAPRPSRRLVGLDAAAEMLGVSSWTVREMVWRGDLPRVRLPRVRRLLFDVRDLEGLIDRSKR